MRRNRRHRRHRRGPRRRLDADQARTAGRGL